MSSDYVYQPGHSTNSANTAFTEDVFLTEIAAPDPAENVCPSLIHVTVDLPDFTAFTMTRTAKGTVTAREMNTANPVRMDRPPASGLPILHKKNPQINSENRNYFRPPWLKQ